MGIIINVFNFPSKGSIPSCITSIITFMKTTGERRVKYKISLYPKAIPRNAKKKKKKKEKIRKVLLGLIT